MKNELVARQISELMLDIGSRLDRSVELIRQNATSDEFMIYRRAVGAVMAEILLEVLNPLYDQHPSIKPPELD